MEHLSFNDKLRQTAKELATGERQELIIPVEYITEELSGKVSASNPASYVRTIMSRVPEVKVVGTVKIKKSICNNDESALFGKEIYTITVTQETRKTIYNKADVERIKRQAIAKTAEKFLLLSPNLANYAPDEYAIVAKVMQEIHALAKMQFIEDDSSL